MTEAHETVRDLMRSQIKGLRQDRVAKQIEIECLNNEISRLEALEYNILEYLKKQDEKGETNQ